MTINIKSPLVLLALLCFGECQFSVFEVYGVDLNEGVVRGVKIMAFGVGGSGNNLNFSKIMNPIA